MGENQHIAKSIFLNAAEIESAAERESYVAAQCGDDPSLRREVEELLGHRQGLGRFMEQDSPEIATLGVPHVNERPGVSVGRYKLLEPIGEGGYGTVFMAEQTSPVHRKVALKIIKAGMDTRQVIARFEAERQALALMDHPNIAKVHDAGVTDTGRPYFVMELVKGIAITRYCDEHKLTPRQRLELFIQVCQAVQHAHQKGIIHRDLKPTNVLVALYDGKPVPKVIDFGVAKATGQQLTERTMFTGFGDVIGTLEYMSPEQAEVNQLDVDTRSDIYSLGVLLYELLTGTTPLEHKRVKEAALLEVLRVIREEEPPRPSTRLTATAELPSIAAQRGLEPKGLSGVVKGELDWIVMKALEKDRSRRYETANGLARDIERYLHDEPVVACPPSTSYRFRKFARRNKGALLAGSAMLAMLLLLVAGLTVSNVRVARERNQKAAALKEREEALAAAKASAERAELERQRAENNFVKARTAVTRILAKAATGQGEWSQLPPELRKIFSDETVAYYESLIKEGSADPSVRYETAVGYRSLGFLHSGANEFEKAERYYRRSIEMLEALLNESANDVEYRHQLAWSNYVLGKTLSATARPVAARIATERSAELYEGLVAQAPSNPKYLPELTNVGILYYELKDYDKAGDCFRKAIERDPRLAAAHYNLFLVLQLQGKTGQAISALENVVELEPNHALRLAELAHLLSTCPDANYRNPRRAVELANRALELTPREAKYRYTLGVAHHAQQEFPEAIAAHEKALAIDPQLACAHNDLAWLLATCSDVRLRDPERAVALGKKAVELDPKNGAYLNTLGVACYRMADWKGATASLEKSMELRQRGDSNDWFFLAMARWQLGDKDGARESYDQAVQWMEKKAPRNEELVRFRGEAAELLGVKEPK